MGSAQSRIGFHPDQSKRSLKSKLPENHGNKLVIFGENTLNQVAYLLDPLTLSPSGQDGYYTSKLKVKFGEQSDPVIGVAIQEIHPEDITIVGNENLFVWFVAKPRVEYRGREQEVELPPVESGDELILNFVVATGHLSIKVVKPGQDSLQRETTLQLPSNRPLLPFVGASSTGNSKVEFLALESTTIIHNNNSFNDLTHKILFTTTYGVINVSRDFRTVTRTATQQGNGCALLPVKLTSGVHRWAFVIRSDFGASMCLGLARYPFMLSDEYVKDHLKHVYRHPGLLLYRSYRGLLYRDGKQLSESLGALGWQHNSPVTIEFVYDATQGRLEVLRNNVSLGVAFDNLVGSFQPVICFYAAYEKDVRLKYYLTTETSPNIVQPMQPSQNASPSTASSSKTTSSDTIGFDKLQLRGNAQISKDGKSLYRDKSKSGNSICYLNIICDKPGVYRLSFIVEYDQGASTCLGVTQVPQASDVKLGDMGNVYTSSDLHMYRSFQGMLYKRGKEQARMAEFWMSGSLVEMEVTITSEGGAVAFKVNAESQRDGLSGLKPPLMPVVGFYAGMEKRVTILHFEYEGPEQATFAKQSSSLKPLLSSLPKSVPVPVPTVLPDSDSSPFVFQSKPTADSTSALSTSTLNDVSIDSTSAQASPLPILCTPQDAAMYYPTCMRCDTTNNTISLPCKHSTMCSKDLSLGINARTKQCVICDARITQIWNILVNR